MTTTVVQQDAADMRALQAGQNEALDRLMLRWQRPLQTFLYRHTQNEFDALDLAQETFVRVFQHRTRFRTEARFSTWLFQIALNLARDRARRLARRQSVNVDEIAEPIDPGEHPRAATETDERARAVRAAIGNLPTDLRAALVLFEYEHKSHAEIAEIVESSAKAVETRIYRARQLLKKSLGRWLK